MLYKEFLQGYENERIIDVGCGTGQFAHFLHDYEFHYYYGFDFSKVAIDVAMSWELDNYGFSVTSVEDIITYNMLSVIDFNVLVTLETLEHLDKENDVRLLVSVPKDKTVIFTVPSFDYESHERHFRSMEEVLSRYGKLLKDEKTFVYTTGNQRYFAVKGLRR